MRTDTATLVPPRRLGALLRQSRVAAGVSLEALADPALTVVDLDDIEHGRRLVDDELLQHLVGLYGVEDANLLPKRSQLVIDLDEGRVAIDEADVDTGELSGPDAVLARYLALVYHLRELPLGTAIALRDLDLDVLSSALELDTDEVTRRLQSLMDDEDAIERDQKRIRRRMLLPLVGVVIAAVSGGALLLVAEADEASEPARGSAQAGGSDAPATVAAITDAVVTEIGPGGAVVENPDVNTDLGLPAVERAGD
ncbi:MAG: helix-turn-helix domain-containing protein [Actinomycetota bacterium]